MVSILANSMPRAKHSSAAKARCRTSRERARKVSAATAAHRGRDESGNRLAADGEIAERAGGQQHRREQECGAALPFGGQCQAKCGRQPIGRKGRQCRQELQAASWQGEAGLSLATDWSCCGASAPGKRSAGTAPKQAALVERRLAKYRAEPCRPGPPFPTPRGTDRLSHGPASGAAISAAEGYMA